jgi:hypothetical protein
MIFKKVLFPLFSIFLAFRSYELVRIIWLFEPSEILVPVKILLAVLLNLFITGVFAFVGFAYNTSQLLPDNYYLIKNPKVLLKISNALKLNYFKKFLLTIYWGHKKNRKKYFNGVIAGLKDFDLNTRQSEFGHLIPFILIQVVAVVVITKGHYQIAGLTTVINIFFNLYPIVLQRNHRMRIYQLRQKQIKKSSTQQWL